MCVKLLLVEGILAMVTNDHCSGLPLMLPFARIYKLRQMLQCHLFGTCYSLHSINETYDPAPPILNLKEEQKRMYFYHIILYSLQWQLIMLLTSDILIKKCEFTLINNDRWVSFRSKLSGFRISNFLFVKHCEEERSTKESSVFFYFQID